tara:strand:- start:90 stop:356 length:267 start_codon:yes stop_codon:yes gene_type:complete
MSYFVYLIGSFKKNKIRTYVGYTNNLKKRLVLHNSSKGAKATRGGKWIVLYQRKYKLKNKAMSKEYYLKKNKKMRKKIVFKFLSTNQL